MQKYLNIVQFIMLANLLAPWNCVGCTLCTGVAGIGSSNLHDPAEDKVGWADG